MVVAGALGVDARIPMVAQFQAAVGFAEAARFGAGDDIAARVVIVRIGVGAADRVEAVIHQMAELRFQKRFFLA